MKSGVKQRVIDLAENKAESICGFAKAINVAQTTLSEYLNNGKIPSFKVVNGILDAYPDVSAEWLLRGEGEMYKTTELPPVDASSEESIEHSAEIARLVKEKNELIEKVEALKAKCAKLQELTDELSKENIAIAAQRDMAKDLLREYMMVESAQKAG
jgi:transcriptional regulator with XRE-family HTH domain